MISLFLREVQQALPDKRCTTSKGDRMKKIYLSLITLVVYAPSLEAMAPGKEPAPVKRESPHVITLFMKPYEELEALPQFQNSDAASKELKENLFQDPFYIARTYLKGGFTYETDPRGVYTLYAGYVDRVDLNRQATFPRLTEKDEIDVIVTRKIRPIIMEGNTVNFFLREEKAPIAYYRMKRHVNPNDKLNYWETTKLEKPTDKQISPSALIIFAEPDAIYIPTDLVIATPGANLVLPPIYATDKLEKDYSALSFVKVNHYFAPIEKVTKIAPPKRYGQMIRP